MAAVFTAHVRFIPEHFNPRCGVVIPARWAGDVALPCGLTYGGASVQEDAPTRAECIAGLIAGLRERGLTGTLRVLNA